MDLPEPYEHVVKIDGQMCAFINLLFTMHVTGKRSWNPGEVEMWMNENIKGKYSSMSRVNDFEAGRTMKYVNGGTGKTCERDFDVGFYATFEDKDEALLFKMRWT